MKAGYRCTASLGDCLLGRTSEAEQAITRGVPAEKVGNCQKKTVRQKLQRGDPVPNLGVEQQDTMEKQFVLWFLAEAQALLAQGRAEDEEHDEVGSLNPKP